MFLEKLYSRDNISLNISVSNDNTPPLSPLYAPDIIAGVAAYNTTLFKYCQWG